MAKPLRCAAALFFACSLLGGVTLVRRSGNAATYPTAGLVAAYEPWRGDQGDAQVLTDFSGNGHHGQIGSTSGSDTNDPAWTASVGLRFATNDYVTFPSSLNTAIDGQAAATVLFLIRSDDALNGRIASFNGASASATHYVWINGNIYSSLLRDARVDNFTPSAVTRSNYHFIAATQDATTWTFYQNLTSVTTASGEATAAFDASLVFGADAALTSYFSGDLVAAFVYSSNVGASGLSDLNNYFKAAYPSGLTGNLP